MKVSIWFCGASWITAVKTLKTVKVLSYLKLKTSYGITGDQAGVGFFLWVQYLWRKFSGISF
jgi:hypothetical protein